LDCENHKINILGHFVKVLFVTYHHLDNNSGIHIFNLANHLTQLGHSCMVCVPNHKEKVLALGKPLFDVINAEEIWNVDLKKPDLIHAWTPREIVRKTTQKLQSRFNCPYIVHLEDNEDFLIESAIGLPIQHLEKKPTFLIDLITRPQMSHPSRYKKFLINAKGATVIMEKLLEFIPQHIPRQIIWAGYEENLRWNRPPDLDLKHKLGIIDGEFVSVYTGNVHAANRQEVAGLYEAIGLLNQRHIPIKLIRTGVNHTSFLDKNLNRIRNDFCIELGYVPRENLPLILSTADVLIQPGIPGPFNDYRFPSKIPEYLATGKPVILPRTNIGLHLKDNNECLWLEDGDALDIAQKLELLLSDKSLRKKIGSGGLKFAEEHLKWGHIAKQLYSFYHLLLERD
jgi:glycosyltransferase involved in cell wall biosynthesis